MMISVTVYVATVNSPPPGVARLALDFPKRALAWGVAATLAPHWNGEPVRYAKSRTCISVKVPTYRRIVCDTLASSRAARRSTAHYRLHFDCGANS